MIHIHTWQTHHVVHDPHPKLIQQCARCKRCRTVAPLSLADAIALVSALVALTVTLFIWGWL
jgi:hypothetical protein